MENEAITFAGAFGRHVGDRVLKKIVIPIIQRDYAQGRQNADAQRVRERFLESLYRAVTDAPVNLDFVYGDIDNDGVFTPLDGQQRLTTLFLLHFYAAKKENIPREEWEFLKNFSYETRYSTRNFCAKLVEFCPNFVDKISDDVANQAWFPLNWRKDPTIDGMLVMLDAIDEKFRDVVDLWDKLKNGAVTFMVISPKNMGLTDEIYIKMNSRGKPLTEFEHFKAELEGAINDIDEEIGRRIASKIDREWTDLLWKYKGIIDDRFLRYFKFVCDIICYQSGNSPMNDGGYFDLVKKYFSKGNENALQNILTLERFFDLWCYLPNNEMPEEFLSSFMSHEREGGKIMVDREVDIFGDCIKNYSDKTGKVRSFSLYRMVLLYAIVKYLENRDTISREQFERRIRIINNLIQNSADEISDRSENNRIPAVLKQTDEIMLTGRIDTEVSSSYNRNQLEEEKEKNEYLAVHPEDMEMLYRLEEHPMLYGQISVVGLENLGYTERFESLFRCSWDNVDKALMVIGDYGQLERNKWRFQYGSKTNKLAWDMLFHKSSNMGFENTKNILVELLSKVEVFDDRVLENMIDEFLRKCEEEKRYPLAYYYVKYDVFRPGAFGKMSNSLYETEPYHISIMQTRSQWSESTYNPFLKEVDVNGEYLSKDDNGQLLIIGDKVIEAKNDCYEVRMVNSDEVYERVSIEQDGSGIDVVNRVDILKRYLGLE